MSVSADWVRVDSSGQNHRSSTLIGFSLGRWPLVTKLSLSMSNCFPVAVSFTRRGAGTKRLAVLSIEYGLRTPPFTPGSLRWIGRGYACTA